MSKYIFKVDINPKIIYLFKVNHRNTRKRFEIYSKLTIKTPELRHWRRSGVFIVNFEHISHFFLFLLFALNKYMIAGLCHQNFHQKWLLPPPTLSSSVIKKNNYRVISTRWTTAEKIVEQNLCKILRIIMNWSFAETIITLTQVCCPFF